jgi:DNA-binding CsgD family transcriptional regulator
MAIAQILHGDIVGNTTQLRDLVAESELVHDEMWRMVGLLSLGHSLAFHGDTGEATSAALAAVEAAADLGDYNQGFAYAALAVATLAAGDVEASAQAAEAARSLMSVQPELARVNVVPLAQVALARGDLDTARRWADDAVSVAPNMHRSLALAARAGVAIAQSDLSQAERDAHEALTIAVDLNGLMIVPDVLECVAVLAAGRGDPREATRLFGAAQAVRSRTGWMRFKVYKEAHDMVLAAMREAVGDKEFEDIWAEGAALSADEAIADVQRGRGRRKRPAAGWASLTPAELNVVRLVGEGLANKDIAERLFVSPRTVQAHLSHVYSKLGITSRLQLAQEAGRQR